jgi:alpha/beta superfamily hydrolase
VLVARAAVAEETVTLPTRLGVTEAVLFLEAPHPAASVIFFPGGDGVTSGEPDNFVLRIRSAFLAQGLTVAVADAPSDKAGGIPIDFRAGAAAGQDAAAIVAFLKSKAPAPVWLLGISNGSISAANAAARLGHAQIAGVVLTSSVWSGGMNQVPLGDIPVPVFMVHSRDDSCRLSPFAGTAAGLDALVKAPAKELLAVSGGRLAGNPCKAHSPHGYYGIEDQVVPQTIAWIKAHTPTAH